MKVVDPVCGMTIAADQAVEKVEYAGRAYYFCGEACRKRFDADPVKYARQAPSADR